MIPVLIVPILSRPELLDALLASIDHPVGQIVVIDNGGVVGDLPGVDVIRLPHNIGVSGGWNLGLKVTPQAGWWLIVNHDVQFGPGDLDRLVASVDPASPNVVSLLHWAAFALTHQTLADVGYFDENFHPAYDEDLDYAWRLRLAGATMLNLEFTGSHVGSATIYSNDEYRRRNRETHGANDRYYEAKWGGPKLGWEMFTTPFDKGGSVGSWQLDPGRIRDQAWPIRKGS